MAEYKAGSRKRCPTHPGAIVKRALAELDLTAYAAGPMIGVSKQALSNIIDEKSAVSPEMAVRLGAFFDNGAEVWMKLQADHDLWNARQKLGTELAKIEKVRRRQTQGAT